MKRVAVWVKKGPGWVYYAVYYQEFGGQHPWVTLQTICNAKLSAAGASESLLRGGDAVGRLNQRQGGITCVDESFSFLAWGTKITFIL